MTKGKLQHSKTGLTEGTGSAVRVGIQALASVHLQVETRNIEQGLMQVRRESRKYLLIIQRLWDVEGQENASADQVAITPALKMEVALKMFPTA